jgi:hypothetical protein
MTASQELLKQTGDSDFAKADLKAFQRRVSYRLSRYRKFIKATAKKHGFDWHLLRTMPAGDMSKMPAAWLSKRILTRIHGNR